MLTKSKYSLLSLKTSSSHIPLHTHHCHTTFSSILNLFILIFQREFLATLCSVGTVDSVLQSVSKTIDSPTLHLLLSSQTASILPSPSL